MHLRCAPQGGRAGPEVIQIRAPDIQIFSEALSQSIVNQLLIRLSGMAMSIAILAQVLASGAGSRIPRATAELAQWQKCEYYSGAGTVKFECYSGAGARRGAVYKDIGVTAELARAEKDAAAHAVRFVHAVSFGSVRTSW